MLSGHHHHIRASSHQGIEPPSQGLKDPVLENVIRADGGKADIQNIYRIYRHRAEYTGIEQNIQVSRTQGPGLEDVTRAEPPRRRKPGGGGNARTGPESRPRDVRAVFGRNPAFGIKGGALCSPCSGPLFGCEAADAAVRTRPKTGCGRARGVFRARRAPPSLPRAAPSFSFNTQAPLR